MRKTRARARAAAAEAAEATAAESKWKCQACDWKGVDHELLTAPSPFRSDDILIACPQCRLTEGFDEACDIEDCWLDAGSGTPMKDEAADDYLRTCYKHRPAEKQEEAAAATATATATATQVTEPDRQTLMRARRDRRDSKYLRMVLDDMDRRNKNEMDK